MRCRECSAELAADYVLIWFGGRIPKWDPLPPLCADCTKRAWEAGAKAQAWIDDGCLSPEPPPFPGVRKPRPKARTCERCGGPGGRRYAAGLCGECREAAAEARRLNPPGTIR